MNFSFVDPWHEFLPREGGHVVCVCGSGGKTSLIRRLAEHYRDEGVPVVLTTTTRTEALDEFPVADVDDAEALAGLAGEPAFFVRGGVDEQQKWLGIVPSAVDAMGESWPDRVVLVEVDGSAGKPLKYYRPGEPVWPMRTSLALVVMGLQAMDEPAAEVVHRFGQAEYAPLADLAPGTLWNWDHLLTLLTGESGYLDQIPCGLPTVLVLAGMGQAQDSIGLFDFMGRAMADERIPLAVLCELAGPEVSVRTVCRRDRVGDGDED